MPASTTSTVSSPMFLELTSAVPVMKLVEVIRTEQTSEETIKIVYDVNKKMGKVAVLAKDKPG